MQWKGWQSSQNGELGGNGLWQNWQASKSQQWSCMLCGTTNQPRGKACKNYRAARQHADAKLKQQVATAAATTTAATVTTAT